MYLLATNALILALKDHEPDTTLVTKLLKKQEVNISVLSIAEFLSKASPKEEKRFEKLLSYSDKIEVDENICRIAATYRKKYLKTSKALLVDYLIAAQAKAYNLTLVTNNTKDFPMKDINIIKP